MPEIVTVAVPLLVIVAPAAAVTDRAPWVTLTVVVKVPPSTSLTLTPEIASVVSSAVVWAPGTVLTGASLTGVTLTVTVAVSVTPPEVTV